MVLLTMLLVLSVCFVTINCYCMETSCYGYAYVFKDMSESNKLYCFQESTPFSRFLKVCFHVLMPCMNIIMLLKFNDPDTYLIQVSSMYYISSHSQIKESIHMKRHTYYNSITIAECVAIHILFT